MLPWMVVQGAVFVVAHKAVQVNGDAEYLAQEVALKVGLPADLDQPGGAVGREPVEQAG